MSDMPRPVPLPPAADHERHDALLVAQFVAGDPLDQEQRIAAQGLVGSCGACIELANDLRAVSAAVAGEPVPPRRRDYRLSPEQAEELSGGALTRFLRRLSLPTARAFQPAAAGVLSIGLIFVVAGYAWPDDGSITVQAELDSVTNGEIAAPADVTAAPPAAAEELVAPAEELGAPVEEPAAPAAEVPAAGAAAADEAAESLLSDPEFLESEFFDTLPEHQAGTSDRGAYKSRVETEAEEAESDADTTGLVIPKESIAELGSAAVEEADTDTGSDGRIAGAADALEQGLADDLTAEAIVGAVDPTATSATGAPTVNGDAALTAIDEDGPEDLFIILGLLLVLGGGGLLLLSWLVRRSRDPLLR